MTKKEWQSVCEGTKVTMTIYDHRYRSEVRYIGYIKRMNSNYSQALVKWDNSGSEIWYGRLGLELVQPQ